MGTKSMKKKCCECMTAISDLWRTFAFRACARWQLMTRLT